MTRWRSVLGLVMGTALVASAAAHSLLGWPELHAELQKAKVPDELSGAMHVGWQFGGAAMLTFGVIVLSLFWARLRGRQASPRVGLFIVPGCGLLLASWPTVEVTR